VAGPCLADTCSVTLTAPGNPPTLNANVNLAGNDLVTGEVNPLVCEAGNGGLAVRFGDSECIRHDIDGGGRVFAQPNISPDGGNVLECRGNGLWAGVSPDGCNAIQDRPNGLWAPFAHRENTDEGSAASASVADFSFSPWCPAPLVLQLSPVLGVANTNPCRRMAVVAHLAGGSARFTFNGTRRVEAEFRMNLEISINGGPFTVIRTNDIRFENGTAISGTFQAMSVENSFASLVYGITLNPGQFADFIGTKFLQSATCTGGAGGGGSGAPGQMHITVFSWML